MDPDNELYDASCELLAAAQRVRRAAGGRGITQAVPAALGCVESALAALAVACTTLEHEVYPVDHEPFEDLAFAVRGAEKACSVARSRSGELAL